MWQIARTYGRRWQSSVAATRDSSIQDSMRELFGSMCRPLERKQHDKSPPSFLAGVGQPSFVVAATAEEQMECSPPTTKLIAAGGTTVRSSIVRIGEPVASAPIRTAVEAEEHHPTTGTTITTTEASTTLTETDTDEAQKQQDKARESLRLKLRSELCFYVYDSRNPTKALAVMKRVKAAGVDIHPRIILSLYRMMIVAQRPYEAYDVLKYYRTIQTSDEYLMGDGDINGYLPMYERLCDTIRHCGYRRKDDAHSLATAVAKEIMLLDQKGRTVCYPNFVSAMVEQRWVALGREFAAGFYQQIHDQELEMKGGWYYHLLTKSKRNRQSDLPFADVVRRHVFDFGIRPRPMIILHALENLHPFDDLESVETFLKAMLHLQKQSNQEAAQNEKDAHRYDLDMATFDSITNMAANQGNSEICLLVWEVVESLGREVSLPVFENTICAFAANPFTYQQAFTILSKMEQNGHVAKRPLIRTISTHLRIRACDLDHAFEVVRQLALEGVQVTVSMLNVLMSGAAERGDSGRAVRFYQEFEHYGLKPDVDTFSFVFESLGKFIRAKKNNGYAELRLRNAEALVETATSFLERMEQQGITANKDVYRNYIEFLLGAGRLDKASSIVFAADSSGISLDSKTIYTVAMANARKQKFEVARRISRMKNDASIALARNIEREERVAGHDHHAFHEGSGAASSAFSSTQSETVSSDPNISVNPAF